MTLIHDAQREIGAGQLLPARAAELLLELTALMGNVNDEIRLADHAYAVVLVEHLERHEAAARAKIRAETSAEYWRRREARDTKELVQEMVRSLKYFLRSSEEEMRLSR